MNAEILNDLPCGYISIDDSGMILASNQPLLDLLDFTREEIHLSHIDTILTEPSRLFYQLYFLPMIKVQGKVNEMYITLSTKSGKEVPVLLNAKRKIGSGTSLNDCIFIPMYKRNEFEDEIIKAKKDAERAKKELQLKHEELVILLNENKKYQVKIQKELELAKKIQNATLSIPFTNEKLAIASFYEPSNELSGDMFSFYKIDDEQYGVIMIDVMGHGISSALITISLFSLFQSLMAKGEATISILQQLDQYLLLLFGNSSDIKHYATILYMTIHTSKQEIEYINAGHPTAFIYNEEETILLPSTNPPVGLFEGVEFKTKKISYNKFSRLFLYTDGITDVVPQNQLIALLKKSVMNPLDNVKEEIVQFLHKQKDHIDETDDQSFILIDFKPY